MGRPDSGFPTAATSLQADIAGKRLILVSEDGQRMPIGRLRGLMWRDKMELRLKGYASRRAAEEARRTAKMPKVKVLVIDLGEYRHQGIAAS